MDNNRETLSDYLFYISGFDFSNFLCHQKIENKSLDFYVSKILYGSEIVYIQKDAVKTLSNYQSLLESVKIAPVLLIVDSQIIKKFFKWTNYLEKEEYIWFFSKSDKLYVSWNRKNKTLTLFQIMMIFFLLKKYNKKYFICANLDEGILV